MSVASIASFRVVLTLLDHLDLIKSFIDEHFVVSMVVGLIANSFMLTLIVSYVLYGLYFRKIA